MKDYYSTNDNEGSNNKVKELSENKKMTLLDCIDLFEEISKSKRNETILSIRCLGKYLISEGYGNFIFSANTWAIMDEKSQLNRINGFFIKRIKENEQKTITAKFTKKKNKKKTICIQKKWIKNKILT